VDRRAAEDFFLAIGVQDSPRLEAMESGDADQLVEVVVDRLDYPRLIRGCMVQSAAQLRKFYAYEIVFAEVPDRWGRVLREGDAAAVVAYLLSSVASLLEKNDPSAKLRTKETKKQEFRVESMVTIPGAARFLLETRAWIPVHGGGRRRPTAIMLSSIGRKVIGELVAECAVDPNDPLLALLGARAALDSILGRLGAAASLESFSSDALYKLLLDLPARDPTGDLAPGIYRTLLESSANLKESASREHFIEHGLMWGNHKGRSLYLSVASLRYNSNISLIGVIESRIPLVDLPRRKSARLVEQLFGVKPLASGEIEHTLQPEETQYDSGSEDARRHLRHSMPYVYALRLAKKLDDDSRELKLLKKIQLNVCSRVTVSVGLPEGVTEKLALDRPGERLAIDGALYVVDEYDHQGHGFTRFWQRVAGLVAEVLGIDVTAEIASVLRCRTSGEMEDLVVEMVAMEGRDGPATLAAARERFSAGDFDTAPETLPLPPPRATLASGEPEAMQASIEPSAAPPSRELEHPVPAAGDLGSPKSPSAPPSVDPPSEPAITITTITPPSRPAVTPRNLVVTGACPASPSGSRPIATEDVTFRVVEAYERSQGRFTIQVSHLRGRDGFGCDILSVGSSEVRERAVEEKELHETDILRYIEVKGSRQRTGLSELEENERRAAEIHRARYFIYRVHVDPHMRSHFELAMLADPLHSAGLRTFMRFDLREGSGALWVQLKETGL